MRKIPFLHCGKCGMSFMPKNAKGIPVSIRRLRVHRGNCKNEHIVEKSYSVTDKNGSHVVYRTWAVVI